MRADSAVSTISVSCDLSTGTWGPRTSAQIKPLQQVDIVLDQILSDTDRNTFNYQ